MTKQFQQLNTAYGQLNTAYEKACNDILRLFCETYELPHYKDAWVGDVVGGVACVGDYFINFEDIMLMLQEDVPFDTFLQHYDYVIEASEVGVATPSLRSWLQGCPRLSTEEVDELYKLKVKYDCKLHDAKEKLRINKMTTEHTYTLHLTEKQVKVLSYACDRLMRIICGQDWTYEEFMEEAWEKRCKEATGNTMDKEWDGGWAAMREEAELIGKQIKKRFWGLESNALYGIRYDDYADILFDIHRVLRHQLWKDKDGENKSPWTVDAEDHTHSIGSEPLAKIERKQ